MGGIEHDFGLGDDKAYQLYKPNVTDAHFKLGKHALNAPMTIQLDMGLANLVPSVLIFDVAEDVIGDTPGNLLNGGLFIGMAVVGETYQAGEAAVKEVTTIVDGAFNIAGKAGENAGTWVRNKYEQSKKKQINKGFGGGGGGSWD